MASLYIIIPVVCHLIFLVTGSIGNIFILFVHILDWMKTKKLNPVDFIISCIIIINLFLQISVAFSQICLLLFLEFYTQFWVVNTLVVIMVSLSLSSLWCSTCLCFYYFVKIITFNWTWLYRIKAKLLVIVPWLLVVSCTISWAFGMTAYWDIYVDSPGLPSHAIQNKSDYHLAYKSRCGCIFQIFMCVACIPFTIIIITSGTIIFSLCKHVQKIKKNEDSSRNSKLHSHLKATKTMTSLLAAYLIFYGMLNIVFSENEGGDTFRFIIAVIVASAFPTANAVIFISANRKLLIMLKHILCIKQSNPNVEVIVTVY